ncbi:nuclear envelope pore membrane protein POM 121-like [Notamacropus eugenii]|uniref:nuclear envelope pore membrane protein POM 121-like n=1 Tax=Notamacropus eugenii TaxID=9315 RepID=UPI003B681BE9
MFFTNTVLQSEFSPLGQQHIPMAELETLTDELTCSMCLRLFREPVTIPCGHNFCSPCLDEVWGGQSSSFYCSRCWQCFWEKPQLKKNTALCEVVKQVLQAQSLRDSGQPHSAPRDGESSNLQSTKAAQGKDGSMACDYCLQAPAAKTCFTCMASFCQEHLQPHLDNPTFQSHELKPLSRKCPEHSRLQEFFCPQHGVCICSVCLVGHKTCSPLALNVDRPQLKFKMKQKLMMTHDHLCKTLKDLKLKQLTVQETAARKMNLLTHEYKEMKALIESDEKSSLRKLKNDEKRVLDKYDHVSQVLQKKKGEIESMKKEIEHFFTKNDEIAFLEKASKLVETVYPPKIELNREMIHNVFQNAYSLKKTLKYTIHNLQEKKTKEPTSPETTSFSSTAPPASSTNPLLDSVEKVQNSPSPLTLTGPSGASAGVPFPLKQASPPTATGFSEQSPSAAISLSSMHISNGTATSQSSPAPVLDNSTKHCLEDSPKPNILFGMLSAPPLTSSAPAPPTASAPSTPVFKPIWGASPKMESRASLLAGPFARAPVSCGSVFPTAPCTSSATFKSIFGNMGPHTSVPLTSASPFLKQPSSVTPTTAVLAPLCSVPPNVQSPAAPATAATTSSSGITDSGSKNTFGFGLSNLARTTASAPPTNTTTTTPSSLLLPFVFGAAPASGTNSTLSTGFMFQLNKPAAATTATTATTTVMTTTSMLSFGDLAASIPVFSQSTFGRAAQPISGKEKVPTSFVTSASTQSAFFSTDSVFSFSTTTTPSFGATTQTTSSFIFSSITQASSTFGSSTPADSSRGFAASTAVPRTSLSTTTSVTTSSGDTLNQNSLGTPSQSTLFAFSEASTTMEKPGFGGTSTPTFAQNALVPEGHTVDSGLSFGTPITSA